ncbi:F-box protein At3g07870-like [Cornus florida]|uniref:F-box protein At3g07870-like n=1 Tax=Cornus florida TaxID=4283 RepID=UPI002897B2CE|nr:F-box protein At3g07870-like [Cornus florida]
MSTDQSPTVATELPRDVIIDILSRLPVRSVIRFSSVCKSWYALIKNPNFITKHFNQSSSSSSSSSSHTTDDDNTYFLYTPLNHSNTSNDNANQSVSFLSNNNATFDLPINLDIPFLSISKPFRVSGSCNGLVCLSILPLGPIIMLWNPATRVFKDLPISPLTRPQTLPMKVVISFGFDRNANDYKVLRIVYCCYPINQVDVYSLSTNSWREIKTDMRYLIFESSCSVVLGGRFHWKAVGFQELNGKQVIVSFDMGTEKFRHMLTPRFGLDNEKFGWHLVVFKERLGVIASMDDGSDKKFDIWVMNEYGVMDSWAKYISFEPHLTISRPLRCRKNGEVLLEKNNGKLVLYDPTTQAFKNVGVHGVVCWSEVFIHVQSLLPIKGGKVVEETNLSAIRPDPYFVRKFDLVLLDR